MQQIRQFKHNSKKSNPNQANLSLYFDYILKNPELITQIYIKNKPMNTAKLRMQVNE